MDGDPDLFLTVRPTGLDVRSTMTRFKGRKDRRRAPKGWRPILVDDASYAWKVEIYMHDDGWHSYHVVSVRSFKPDGRRSCRPVSVELTQVLDGGFTPEEVAASIRLLLHEGWKPELERQENELRRIIDPAELETKKAETLRKTRLVIEVMAE